jgi:hypothetical protein
MSYSFEIVGITPVLAFFNHQQQLASRCDRSKVYLGSHQCTLDAFIESTNLIPEKPLWDWDEVIETTINFWLLHEADIRYWKQELKQTSEDNLIIARVANIEILRQELEELF